MHLTRAHRLVLSSSLSVFLAGCGSPNYAPSEMHLTVEKAKASAPASPESIPALVKATPTVPTLSTNKSSDTFDVVVTNQPVRDVLFVLARDAEIDMDVDSAVGGLITMSALDETLDAILERIARQVPIRVDHVGRALVVKLDEPYHKRYHVDYISVSRSFSSTSSTDGIGGGDASITNESSNSFWENLEESIGSILEIDLQEGATEGAVAGVTDERLEDLNDAKAGFSQTNSFDFNPDTGILLVYAPDRLQIQVEQYLNEAMSIVSRQVLLEATVVEVVLNNQYRQGIDWSAFNQFARDGLALYQGASVGGAAAFINELIEEFDISQERLYNETSRSALERNQDYQRYIDRNQVSGGAGSNITEFDAAVEEIVDDNGNITGYLVTRDYSESRPNVSSNTLRAGGLIPANSQIPGSAFTAAYRGTDVSAAVELLDTFGDAKVLSSPRISVLHNQPALLRVVDQEVYFSIEVDESIDENTGNVTSRSYDVTENTVDVGFAMNVLPHITAGDTIFLNLKPSVNRVLSYRRAPVPAAIGGGSGEVDNLVPITRIREMESVMSLRDGEIAVMGGLLEDRTGDNNTSVPGLSQLPGVGSLFQKKNEQTYKTEFVVFIKARIITNPSIHGDYSDYTDLLPDSDFIIRDRATTGVPPKQKKAR